MRAGSECGDARGARWGVALFLRDDGGYTTVAVAVALLVSVSLVLCVASAEWTMARSGDVQPVADATAMAGANTVAAYVTVAQVMDACVLSMGLTGVAVLGAGLVMAAIPGVQAASPDVLDAGKSILEARTKFARSACEGLQKIEYGLPYLSVLNSASVVGANSTEGLGYLGVAIPFPQESQSDFSSLDDGASGDEVADQAERLRDATQRAEEAKERADEARRRGWEADCVDSPSCLRSRAESLAGMWGSENPHADQPEYWDFGMPIRRSRAYYAHRIEQEGPTGPELDDLTNSRARSRYYEYALDMVNGAWYMEEPDGHVGLDLPHLARNSDEVRDTWLYEDPWWPCTYDEEEGSTLHSTLECPGATGELDGFGSVASVERGDVNMCDTCRMSVVDLGQVAAITSFSAYGYECYWQKIVESAWDYREARNEQADAENDMRQAAEDGKGAFERVLDQLRVPRPKICPPGAWGCVSVVVRPGGSAVPSELTDAFLTGAELPPGAAVAAATLAPDEETEGNDVLSRFFDGLGAHDEGSPGGFVLGSVTGLWGSLLLSYGSAYEGVGDAVGGFLDRIDGLFGGTVGAWLKQKVASIMEATGLEPGDLRLRKPVLVHTGKVLSKAGLEPTGKVRDLVQSLPDHGSPAELAQAAGVWVWDEVKDRKITIAELTIPGTEVTIPITVDLQTLAGVA